MELKKIQIKELIAFDRENKSHVAGLKEVIGKFTEKMDKSDKNLTDANDAEKLAKAAYRKAVAHTKKCERENVRLLGDFKKKYLAARDKSERKAAFRN